MGIFDGDVESSVNLRSNFGSGNDSLHSDAEEESARACLTLAQLKSYVLLGFYALPLCWFMVSLCDCVFLSRAFYEFFGFGILLFFLSLSSPSSSPLLTLVLLALDEFDNKFLDESIDSIDVNISFSLFCV